MLLDDFLIHAGNRELKRRTDGSTTASNTVDAGVDFDRKHIIINNNAVASEQTRFGEIKTIVAPEMLSVRLAKSGARRRWMGKDANSRTPAEAQNKAATGGETPRSVDSGVNCFWLVRWLQADVGRLS